MKLSRKAHLVLLQAVLEDVLDDQATGFAKRNFMPHASESLVHVFHYLRRRITPTKLEEFLPDMASISMDDRFRNAS